MKNKKDLISVIVPIYNVEKFLPKCLKTIANQTFKNLEVLLIDDGSTDSSGQIADKFSKNRDNFHVFHIENNGSSNARNFGIEKSRGDYICFVDSDDFLHEKFIERLHELILEHDAQISCCNFFFYFPKIKMKMSYPFKSKSFAYSSSSALKKLISGTNLQSFVWNKMYKASLFSDNDIRFDEIYFEDLSIMPRLFYYSKNIVVTNESLYYYVQRKGSVLHSVSVNKIEDYIKSFGSIRNFLEQQKEYKTYKKHMNSYKKKIKFMKNLYIFNLHLKDFNFKNLTKNFKNSSKSINFFLEENYISTSNSIPKMPFSISDPKEKKGDSKI